LRPDRERLTAQATDELLRMLKRDFAQVLVVFHPEAGELTSTPPGAEKQFEATAARNGVGFLTLRPHYQEALVAGHAVHADGLHLNRAGTALVANVLAQQLARTIPPAAGAQAGTDAHAPQGD